MAWRPWSYNHLHPPSGQKFEAVPSSEAFQHHRASWCFSLLLIRVILRCFLWLKIKFIIWQTLCRVLCPNHPNGFDCKPTSNRQNGVSVIVTVCLDSLINCEQYKKGTCTHEIMWGDRDECFVYRSIHSQCVSLSIKRAHSTICIYHRLRKQNCAGTPAAKKYHYSILLLIVGTYLKQKQSGPMK